MRKLQIWSILVTLAVAISSFSCTQNSNLKALVVTGQNNHNWQKSSLYLKDILDKSKIFNAEIIVSPKRGKDMSDFIIDFKTYDVVVLDYNGDEWPEQTKINFVNYVENGGVVVFHAADNAFPNWPEYNQMIGLGGWEGRDEKSGPYVYIKDGEIVRDNLPEIGGSHGQQHEFVVEAFKPEHPILKGLPPKWLHAKDELYSELRGPAKNMEILAYASASEKFNGTGKNEPILMTINYNKGRIFHTVLGHAGGGVFFPAMECAGFITTLQRGAEWAATGKVKQKVPNNFPTENQSLTWEFFEDIDYDLTSVVNRLKNYEIGKSYDSFNILKKLITENIGNPEKLNHYQTIILNLLKSNDTSIECKRIICKEFSWVANDSYLSVFEELKNNPDLINEAQYAIDRMEK